MILLSMKYNNFLKKIIYHLVSLVSSIMLILFPYSHYSHTKVRIQQNCTNLGAKLDYFY